MTKVATSILNAEKQAPPRVLLPLTTDRVKLAQHKRNDWHVNAPDSLTVEQLEVPELWTLATNIRRGDRVSVIQSHRYTELVAFDDGPGFVAMRVMATVELPMRREGTSTSLPPGFVVRRAEDGDSALGTWVAVRVSDGHIYNKDQPHYSFEQARTYLLNHAAVINRGDKANLWHEGQ